MAKKTKTQKKIEAEMKPGKVSFKTTCGQLKALTSLTMIITKKAVLEFTPSGLEVRVVDEKVTHAGHITLTAEGMEGYGLGKNKTEFLCGIDLKHLHEFLGNLNVKDEVECDFDEEKMRATFKSGNLSRTVELLFSYDDWKTWRKTDLKIQYQHEFKDIDSKDILIGMKGVEDVNDDEVIFESNKSGFLIMAEDNGDDIEVPFGKKGKTKRIKSKFRVGPVKAIVREMNGKATLSMGEHIPIEFSWFPAENMGATFMVAPLTNGD